MPSLSKPINGRSFRAILDDELFGVVRIVDKHLVNGDCWNCFCCSSLTSVESLSSESVIRFLDDFRTGVRGICLRPLFLIISSSKLGTFFPFSLKERTKTIRQCYSADNWNTKNLQANECSALLSTKLSSSESETGKTVIRTNSLSAIGFNSVAPSVVTPVSFSAMLIMTFKGLCLWHIKFDETMKVCFATQRRTK